MRKFVLCAVAAMLVVSMYVPVYAAPQADTSLSGKVVETMDSGGYTYVQLDKKGKKTWVACPAIKGVKKGQTMSFQPGDEMRGFTSKTLNRTFDSIIFSPGPVKK